MDKISILMPTFNRENFLERSINSILNQTYENIDLIIYDDGSSDNSVQVIKKFMKKDSRIKLFEGVVNKGVGFARNKLLNVCNTKYAIWMDSDDVSATKRIELQLKEMTEDKLVFCTWENLTKKQSGTTKGFATLMFPVRKDIIFDDTIQWGGEDWKWIKEMRSQYPETLIEKVLYSIDFHGSRIGTWKRKLWKDWGGIYTTKELKRLTYSEAIKKYEIEKRN